MARNDFISDHLVNMRDRLKQNYAEKHSSDSTAAASASSAPAVVEPGASADSAASAVPERGESGTSSVKNAVSKMISSPATALRTSGRSEEFDRMRRDLEERLNRDTAAVAAELEHAAQRRAELERFQEKLADFTRRYAELAGAGDAEAARRLEHLRIEYYQAYGRVRAFDASSSMMPGAGNGTTAPGGHRAEWMAPAATLAATVLLCVTLLILFW